MKVLIYFPGELNKRKGTPLRIVNLAKALVKYADFNVKTISFSKPFLNYNTNLQEDTIPNTNKIIRINILRSKIIEYKPDIVYGMTHNSILDIFRTETQHIASYIFDLHGDYLSELKESKKVGLIQNLKIHALDKAWGHYLRKADGVTVVSPLLSEFTKKRYNIDSKVIYGGVDVDIFSPKQHDQLNENSVIKVIYIGNYNSYQGVGDLIEAIEQLGENKYKFKFTFGGDLNSDNILWSRIQKCEVCEYIGKINYEDVPSYLASMDILVIPRVNSLAAKYGFPSKLPEYMSMGKPILTTNVGVANHILTNGVNAIIVEPGSSSIKKGLLDILKGKYNLTQIGMNARNCAKEFFSWNNIANNLKEYCWEINKRR